LPFWQYYWAGGPSILFWLVPTTTKLVRYAYRTRLCVEVIRLTQSMAASGSNKREHVACLHVHKKVAFLEAAFIHPIRVI